GSQDVRGRLLVVTLAVARAVTDVLGAILIAIAVLAVARALLLFALAGRHVREVRRQPGDRSYAPGISIVVPAFNEAVGIQRAVRSLAGGDYEGEREVIVVDDGSADGTGDLVERLALSRVRVIRQANGGKASALNRGIGAAAHDVIVTVD